MEKIPQASSDLIAQLDKMYPQRHPFLKETDREIWLHAGERAVVDMLMARKKAEEENTE